MASLKEQLDAAGYDTSTLDEAAVLKQLNDAGYDTSSFSAASPGLMETVGAAAKNLLPSVKTLEAPMKISEKLGKEVEAGGAGIGDVITGKGLPQAAETVKNVEEGIAPTTPSGKVGKFVGSFFTPNQIALQVTGAAAAPYIVKGLGATANTVGKLISRPTEAVLPTAQKGVSEVISGLTGAEPEALQQVMQHGRQAVEGAASFPQLAEQAAGSMNKLSTHIGDLTKAANATLRDAPAFGMGTNQIQSALQTAMESVGDAAIPEVNSTREVLQNLATQLKAKYPSGIVPETEVANWVKSIQKGINWNDPTGTVKNQALSKVQGIVNDALKASNTNYAAAEEKVADAISLKNNLAKALGITREAGEAWTPKDVAASKLRQLMNPENKASTIKLLKELADIPGMQDIVKAVQQSAAKESINAPATGAHRLFGLGTRLPALGGVLAGLVPKAANLATSAIQGGVKATPAVGNAIYQGLSD